MADTKLVAPFQLMREQPSPRDTSPRHSILTRVPSLAGREGYVLPTFVFALAIMSLLAGAALFTASNEHRSSRAFRESSGALYAAEAGVNWALGSVSNSIVAALTPGDSVDLGWQMLSNGASHRPVLHRTDDARGQELYLLAVEGRGAGTWGGQRMINFILSRPLEGVPIPAAVSGLGEVEVENGATVSGLDRTPPGWGGACSNPLQDKPGIVVGDTSEVDVQGGSTLEGTPPLVQDTTINKTNLLVWGDLTYSDLVAMADIVISGGGGKIGPKVNGGACDTSDPLNWGDPLDPTSPCFDYWPIIHVNPQLEIQQGGYGQGILLVDAELEIEVTSNFTFYGIIISPGEVELENNVTIIGGLITGKETEAEKGPNVLYSQCAVDRANRSIPGALGSLVPLSVRSWNEALR